MTFDSAYVYSILHPHFQQRVLLDEPLAQHSSFGVGGTADIWIEVGTREELGDLIKLCVQRQWPLLIVGAGSNILFADAGVRGIVASVAFRRYQLEEQRDGTALVIAEAGVRWNDLLKDLIPHGWSGLEFGIGIPGTLGGGIISNTGAHNHDLGQVLEWIEVLDARGCMNENPPPVFPVISFRRYPKESLDLGYRHSRFREGRVTHIDANGQLIIPSRNLIEPTELVVTLALCVHHDDPARLEAVLQQHAQTRTHDDPAQRHAGSIFKDPIGTGEENATAATLIAQAGLAGKRHGGAEISKRNANYILNLDEQGTHASAGDIAALIIEAHQGVLAQTGISMALNVELLGAWKFIGAS